MEWIAAAYVDVITSNRAIISANDCTNVSFAGIDTTSDSYIELRIGLSDTSSGNIVICIPGPLTVSGVSISGTAGLYDGIAIGVSPSKGTSSDIGFQSKNAAAGLMNDLGLIASPPMYVGVGMNLNVCLNVSSASSGSYVNKLVIMGVDYK